MDTYKLNLTLEQKIFSLLSLRAGEKLSQREIAHMLKVSPTAVANSLKKLKNIGMIKVEKTKTINFTSFNRDNSKAIDLKRVENLKNIYTSGLSNFLEESFPGGTIILFGSYSRGEDASKSDIDIAVIGRKDKKIELEKYEDVLKRNITLNFYPAFKNINKHLKNNILNGILLHGSIEL